MPGFGDQIDLADLAVPDRETECADEPSVRDDREAHGPVHKSGLDELGGARVGERVGTDGPGTPHLGSSAGQLRAVVPEQDVGVEHREERLEVTFAHRGEEGVNDLLLAGQIGLPGRGLR